MTPGTKGPAHERAADPDMSWRGLYRVGAASAALYLLLLVLGIVLIPLAPQPSLTGGAAVLEYIAQNKLVYLAQFVAFVGLCLPAIVVFLALAVALKHLDKSYAALGALVGIGSEVAALAYNSSPPSLHSGLPYLSNQFAAATTDAQRASLAAAAEALIAASNAVNPIGIVTALGILLISLPMLKSLFFRRLAYLGIATGVVGMFSEAFRDVIGPVYFLYGLLLLAWFTATGWRLYRLGWGDEWEQGAGVEATGLTRG